jgi:hypothetical protein
VLPPVQGIERGRHLLLSDCHLPDNSKQDVNQEQREKSHAVKAAMRQDAFTHLKEHLDDL